MLKILFSWIWLYSAKRKDRRKGYEKKEQRTEVNYLEQIMDSKCNMSTCRKLKGCFGINEQHNLDCNIAYAIFIPYFVSKLYSMWMIEKQDMTHFLRHWILNSKARHPFIHILQHVQTSTNRISKGCMWPRKHKR